MKARIDAEIEHELRVFARTKLFSRMCRPAFRFCDADGGSQHVRRFRARFVQDAQSEMSRRSAQNVGRRDVIQRADGRRKFRASTSRMPFVGKRSADGLAATSSSKQSQESADSRVLHEGRPFAARRV